MPTLTNFSNEQVIFSYRKEYLVSVDDPKKPGRRMLVAIHKNGFNTDYPLVYNHNDTIGYENPECFSKRFKERAARHIRAFNPYKKI